MLKKSIWHLLVQLVKVSLNFSLNLFDQLYYFFGVLSHVFLELKLFLDDFLLVELNVAGLEEMWADDNGTLDLSFSDDPFRDPFSCDKVVELHIFAGYAYMDIEWFLR